MNREERIAHIDETCNRFLETSRCCKCPIYDNCLCDKIFNEENATDEEVEEAFDLMVHNYMAMENAWDIIKNMKHEEYEDFKEFLYDKYASMCSLEDLINEFTNDELVHKYRVFKGVEEDV